MAYSTLAFIDNEYYSRRDADILRDAVLEVGINGEWDQRGPTNGTLETCDLGCVQDITSGGISVTSGCAKDACLVTCKYYQGQWDSDVKRVKEKFVEGHGKKIRLSDAYMPTIDRTADLLAVQLKKYCPEAYSAMTACRTTSCRIGNADVRPFSTCTCTMGKQFISPYSFNLGIVLTPFFFSTRLLRALSHRQEEYESGLCLSGHSLATES